MENKVNWDREDCWNEYIMYDDYFLSFHFDHCNIDEDKWKELVKKWGLTTKSFPEEDVTAFNDNYSIVITGNDYDGLPEHYIMLTFSKNINTEYTIHPREISKIMIDKL